MDALLCAGDLYEQERFTPDTAAFLPTTVERLHPLPGFTAPGNHDSLGPQEPVLARPMELERNDLSPGRLQPVTLEGGLTLWGGGHGAPVGTPGFLEEFRVDRSRVHVGLFNSSEQNELAFAGEGKVVGGLRCICRWDQGRAWVRGDG